MSDSSSPFGDNLFEKEAERGAVEAGRKDSAVDGKAEKKDNRSVVGKVHVGDPEIRGSKFSSYHAYKITTDPPVVDHVFRRFSDFVWLREILVKMFPGVFIPPLPPKKLLGSKDDQVVVERQVDLERFLNRIAIRKFLATSEPFQVFLHQSQLFEERVKELDKQAKAKELTEVIGMFKEVFPQPIAEITLSDKTDIEFDAMREFLNNSEQKTQNLLKAADVVAENFEKYLDSISKLNIALNQTYDIEKGYPDRPQPARVEVIDTFLSWQQGEKELINAYHTHLHSIFKYELQDVQAYIEIVKHRYEIHQRYNNTTLKKAKAWDGKPIKNEKQEAEKQTDLQREKDEREYLEILNKLILHSQIKHYWAAKMLLFKKQIETFAAAQVGANGKLKEAWESCQRLSRSKSISESTVSLPEWGLDDF